MANIIALTNLIGNLSILTEDAQTKRDKVLAALEDERALGIVYANKHDIISIRAIRPIELKRSKKSGLLYIVAFDELRGETRNFFVDRILLIQETI
jgi:predicted DNA-binding transcriptional regulator YafY